MFQQQAESKNQTLCMTEQILYPYVYVDEPHLSEVCINIISNAVKYTNAGGTISCKVAQRPCEKEDWCDMIISITDNGIGMSEDFQKHIFEIFERERNSTVSHIEGNGIGMGITKKLVDLMDGSIEVKSKQGEGSIFTVTVPCRKASKEDSMMKKKSKKLLLWLFVLTFVLTGIAGCGTKQKDDQEAASTETAGAISSVDDIVGKKIGVQLGTTGDIYVSDYENDGSGTTVERYNKGADAVQALKQGKIDCVVIDEQPALAFVEENPGLKILDEEFTLEEYAIVTAKGNDDLLEKVNTALEELRSEGTLDRITKNYIGTDAEKGNYPYEPQDVSRGNGTLTMGTNAEFPPYEYYENNEIVGIDVDIMQAIADKLGMELKIEDMAFDSIIPAVSTGKIDVGAAGFTVTEERKKNVNFTDTYATSKQVIIVRDGNAVTAKSSFGEKFYQNFIQDNRYAYMLKGLGNTLIITIFAVMIGIVLGFLIAIVRTSHDSCLLYTSDAADEL